MAHRFIVAQLGGRMHYAVPRILHRAGILERSFTDFSANHWCFAALNLIPRSARPPFVKRILRRVPKGVPSEKIKAFNLFGLNYARKLRRSLTPEERTSAYLWAGKEFCRKVLDFGLGPANAAYTFNTAGLEILQAARGKGLLAVMEQTIIPKQIEVELLKNEYEYFSDWELDSGRDGLAKEVIAREKAEWEAAHLILCASEFVREGIRQCGGPEEKCVVVPYGVDISRQDGEGRRLKIERYRMPSTPPARAEPDKERPLRVLTVGTVGLRKGSPYVLEAAKRLNGRAVFRMVGSIGVARDVEAQLRHYLELKGPIPHSEISSHFEWGDVFLLPSICEGSATVTYEALGHGLPVICTPNTGSMVRDRIDGFIVPIRDSSAIVDCLERLDRDRALLKSAKVNALGRAREFTLERYGQRLLDALRGTSKEDGSQPK